MKEYRVRKVRFYIDYIFEDDEYWKDKTDNEIKEEAISQLADDLAFKQLYSSDFEKELVIEHYEE